MSRYFKSVNRYILFSASIGIATLFSAPGYSQTQIQFDYTNTRQTIDNFGASDAWSINPTIKKWDSENRQGDIEELADYLFSTDKGIGLSAWRFNIGAGSAEQGGSSNIPDSKRRAELLFSSPNAGVDKTKQRGQIRFLQEAHERGVTDFVAFANSPPTWATKNGLAHPGNGSGIGSTNLEPSQTQNFAKFLTKVVQYLRGSDVNVPVNHLSPINEPTWSWQGQSQEGNRYNIDDMKSVYRATYDALQDAGLSGAVKLDGAEVVEYTAALSDDYKREFDGNTYNGGMNSKGVGKYKNYIDEFLGNNEFRTILGNKISMHGYFSDAWSDRMGKLRDLTWENVNDASSGAKIWMSEMTILGDPGNVRDFRGSGWDVNDMEYALHVGKMIHRDLTRLNASAWHWWLGVTPYNYKDGLLKINSSLDANSLETSKVLWTVGQFSRFVRPGYKRIHLPNVDDLNGLMASAYRAPDNSKLVIVLVNAGSSAKSIALNIDSLPSNKELSSFAAYSTSSSKNLSRISDAQVGSDYQVPGNSIVTLVANLDSSGGSGSTVHMKKRNSQGFAIDGNRGGTNGQNVYLYSSNTKNINQKWNEIDRGNGFYSYQKANTNYCLDGNWGGKNGQSVYLWTCSDNNQNQHWKKVSAAGNTYRLEKRNAPGFAIDGNRGGANFQDLYLWQIGTSNQNQQWIFTEVD